MALASVAITNGSPTSILAIPPGTRKLLICNPSVNAQLIAVKLDWSATALTFANGIQIPIGGTFVLDLDLKECPVQVQAISATGAAVCNLQTLGTGV